MKMKLPKTIEKYRNIIEDIEYASPWSGEWWKFNLFLKFGYSFDTDDEGRNGQNGIDCQRTLFVDSVREAQQELRKVVKCDCEKCYMKDGCGDYKDKR